MSKVSTDRDPVTSWAADGTPRCWALVWAYEERDDRPEINFSRVKLVEEFYGVEVGCWGWHHEVLA